MIKAVNSIDSDLLAGLTIVLSGIMQKLAREKLEIWITEHGGKCTGSVSGKTNILVVGEKLEDGREVTGGNKYKTAV
jgi:replication factor C subunit 1